MDKQQEQLETLRDIRSLMERSSRFISLSGFSGVIAGIAAIIGVVAAYSYLGMSFNEPGYYKYALLENGELNKEVCTFLTMIISAVLIASLLAASILTMKNAKQKGRPVWDVTAKRMLINLMIPLITGAVYCLILLYHHNIAFIAPATLIFYGLALLNASKYTLNDIRFLGVLQVITGLLSMIFLEYALLLWSFGFGLLHIVYGITMYYKYEK